MAALLGRGHVRPPVLPVFIGLPDPRPGLPAGLGAALSHTVAELGIAGAGGADVTLLPRGHAAGLLAMEQGCHLLRQGRAGLCLVGGVDSYLTADSLEWMDEQGILKSSVNRNGFPPGEAAGFCLLATASAARQWGLPVLGWLSALASAREDNRIRTQTICVGRGLSDAIAGATSMLRLPDELIDESICDLNGEPYRSEEFAFTTLRTQLAFVDFTRFVTPADCWGDVGAHGSIPDWFTGPVQLQLELSPESDSSGAMVALLATFQRAYTLGFFAPGGRLELGSAETREHTTRVTGRVENVPAGVFGLLARMVRHSDHTQAKVTAARLGVGSQGYDLLQTPWPPLPPPPRELPFLVEYPFWIHSDFRVELAFRHALPPEEQAAVGAAFAVWDRLSQTAAEKDTWGQEDEIAYATRMMSPSIVEHVVNGFFAGAECLDLLVHFALQCSRRLPISHLTFE